MQSIGGLQMQSTAKSLYDFQLATMLCVLAVAFYLQYRQKRSRTTLMWFAGWLTAILHILAIHLTHLPGAIGFADAATVVASLLFLGSFSDAAFRIGRWRCEYVVALASVVLPYAILQSFWTERTVQHSVFLLVLLLLADAIALKWAMEPQYLPPAVALVVVLPAIASSTLLVFLGEYRLNVFLFQSAANLCIVLFVLYQYRRAAWSVVLTCLSFFLWAGMPWARLLEPQWPALLKLYAQSIEPIKLSAALGMLLLLLDQEVLSTIRAREQERRIRRELELYSQIDINLIPGRDMAALAGQLCRQIADASRFCQVVILLRDVEQTFYVAGHAGVKPEMEETLARLGKNLTQQQLLEYGANSNVELIGGNSYRVALQPFCTAMGLGIKHPYEEGIVIPMLMASQLIAGLLLLTRQKATEPPLLADDLLPLEMVAAKFATAMENASLMQRLVRSEKLAGLGQVAGGVAHELNNPLTVVLGYAELTEDITQDETVRHHVAIIREEAQRMKQVIESLVRFWRPAPNAYQQVNIAQILEDVYRLRAADLEHRDINLQLSIADNLPLVSANADRLKQVILQLLNNAVEAVEQPRANHHQHRIRMDASVQHGKLHILVSDTGPGFPEPDRVFDPFFTTKQPGEGSGLGLSICYGIVREHRGEINAFNMHPHGAAVVIELPVQDAVLHEA